MSQEKNDPAVEMSGRENLPIFRITLDQPVGDGHFRTRDNGKLPGEQDTLKSRFLYSIGAWSRFDVTIHNFYLLPFLLEVVGLKASYVGTLMTLQKV